MQGLIRLLCVLLALAPCRALGAEQGQAARFDAEIAAYERMSLAEQVAWLTNLFDDRSLPACRLTLPATEVAAQHARHQAILSRVQAGRKLNRAGLERLLGEVDHQEQAAITRLAVQFQALNEQAYRDDPNQVSARWLAWQQVQHAWKEAGSPWEQQPRMIAWLQHAMALPPLPAVPDFSAVAAQPAAEPAIVAQGTPVPPAVAASAPSPVRAQRQPTAPAPQRTVFRHTPPLDAPPAVVLPPLNLRDSADSAPATRPTVTKQNATPRIAKPSVDVAALASAESPAESVTASRPAMPVPPAAGPGTARTAATTAASRIDLTELDARIGGYNLGVSDVVSRLSSLKARDLEGLSGCVDSLAELATLRADLDLYWNLLPPGTQSRLRAPRSLHTAVSLAAAKSAAARKEFAHGGQAGDGRASVEERRLDRISRQLADIMAAER